MPIKDYATVPLSNTAISGIDISEGCNPANINNALRQQMADIASEFVAQSVAASAAILDLGSQNGSVLITGNIAIGALSAVATPAPAGLRRILIFSGAPLIIYSATLLLPGGANIQAAAGDTAEFESLGGGTWRCLWYQRNGGISVTSHLTNRIINYNMNVNQRGVTSAANQTYGYDRWFVITETGTVTLGNIVAPEPGYIGALRLTQPDAVPKRIGIGQIIEFGNCVDLQGQAVRLLCRTQISSAIPVRFALLAWSGTADAMPRALINNWASTTYTPGNFFVANGNLSVVATGSVQPGAAVKSNLMNFATVLPGGFSNLAILMWTESTFVQNGTIDFWGADLALGNDLVPSPPRLAGQELTLCQRYFEKSYDTATVPGTATTVGVLNTPLFAGQTLLVQHARFYAMLKRTTPTVTWYSSDGSLNNAWDTSFGNRPITSTLYGSARSLPVPVMGNYGTSGALALNHFTADAEI